MNLVQRFLRKGSESTADQFDARRIVLLNLFYGVATLTLLAALIQSRVAGEPVVMSWVLIAGIILLTGVPVAGRRNPNLGAAYILFVGNLIIWFFANSQGINSGAYLYYFPAFFANAWLMDFRKPWNSVLLLSFTVCGLLAVFLVPESVFGLSVSKEIQEASFWFNLITASVMMAINTFVIAWINYRRQQELEQRIVEREKTSAQLSSALKDKEILLAEIHHRVKNNLAVVRGLLNMQLNTTTDETAKATLRESVNRVSAMALIHQKLYTKENPDSIDLSRYVSDLVKEISSSYHHNGTLGPRVHTEINDISLTLTRAVPCGLILNELLSNAFKHAFRDGKIGIINISIQRTPDNNGTVNLVVSDNGSGMPAGFDAETSPTLGITIIQSLCEQLDGKFTFDSSSAGTRMVVNFPIASVH